MDDVRVKIKQAIHLLTGSERRRYKPKSYLTFVVGGPSGDSDSRNLPTSI